MSAKPRPGHATAYVHLLPRIIETAREMGYALAVHGSVSRDLDLIAVPWTLEAASAKELVEAIRMCVDGHIHTDDADGAFKSPSNKPHGRMSWSIYLVKYGPAYIDLSVMPIRSSGAGNLYEHAETDAEVGRFQDEIRAALIAGHERNLPERHRHPDMDGGGCESGDPLDVTMAEIRSGVGGYLDYIAELQGVVRECIDLYERGYPESDHAAAVMNKAREVLPTTEEDA